MTPGALPLEVFQVCSSGPGLTGGITHPTWPRNVPWAPQEKLESVAGEKEAENTLLNLLPPPPDP